MNWLQRLNRTYDAALASSISPTERPWPISHISKKVHVEIVLDNTGTFRRARQLERNEAFTLIPATERSAGRTAGDAPHPLCEELSYCAADLPESDPDRFSEYILQLDEWCRSEFSSPWLQAVLDYVRRRHVWHDLANEKLLPVATEDAKGKKTKVPDEKVFVRWRVEQPGVAGSGSWDNDELIHAWQKFDASRNTEIGFCIATGDSTRLGQNHPRFVRNPSDGGKLISANSFSGMAFRGRFTDVKTSYQKQVCSVGFDVSQRAHSALRWLIARQGFRNGEQVFVAWEVACKPVPDPFASTYELFGDEPTSAGLVGAGNTGQAFALKLKSAIAGYRARLDPRDQVIVIGLDSATPGRMAITYYRELKGSEFLQRIEDWHGTFTWQQDFSKDRKFIGAPAPRDIADAAFGPSPPDALLKATIERLVPCIVDGTPFPADLLNSAVRRACNRIGFDRNEDRHKREYAWYKCLGITCALFNGFYKERKYKMALDTNRASRDYLFGRLLAIAENIEAYALFVAREPSRDTAAARLMQRFADRPASTWRTIELSLRPYMTRLRNLRPGVLYKKEQLLDEVTCAFKPADFLLDTALSGEFLLGYHCQRQALRPPENASDEDAAADTTIESTNSGEPK